MGLEDSIRVGFEPPQGTKNESSEVQTNFTLREITSIKGPWFTKPSPQMLEIKLRKNGSQVLEYLPTSAERKAEGRRGSVYIELVREEGVLFARAYEGKTLVPLYERIERDGFGEAVREFAALAAGFKGIKKIGNSEIILRRVPGMS